MPRRITLDQFLTPEEIQRARDLFNQHKPAPTQFHKALVNEVIKPNIKRINADLGQRYDPDYLAYMVEYVLGKIEGNS